MLNRTPAAERIHIAIFGRRNVGKSSIINAITDSDLSIVSAQAGTTTDPVYKTMELLPLGPVVLIDTPGYDDEGALGEKRVSRTRQVLNRTDLALLLIDAAEGLQEQDRDFWNLLLEKEIPSLIVANKSDLAPSGAAAQENTIAPILYVSAKTGDGIFALKEALGALVTEEDKPPYLQDLFAPSETVVLVCPIDESAPKGRMILPQQMAIRDVLDGDGQVLVVQPAQLAGALSSLNSPPALVVTDSQAFAQVSSICPESIPLTSFSILMARYKGFLSSAIEGAAKIDTLGDGARILMSEGCTHHRQCGDIGTVKLPRLLEKYTKKQLIIETSSGRDFPEDVSSYDLVIHCGGCMLTERDLRYRMKLSADQGVAFTNYGTAIAHMNGILRRSLAPLGGHFSR
ncbi:MAG: [FeFe] hydrogenase H-cluster maturation GTPase HydF [Lachnospiraceae bacterium]|nr:[FeFe] hydrogenase H-cluster maturation GTPase HydF [Lachnospiraceae bacterium]